MNDQPALNGKEKSLPPPPRNLERGTDARTVPIVFSTDENFAPYLCTALQSLAEHTKKDFNYKIYILYLTLGTHTMKLLSEQIRIYTNISVEFRDVSQYMDRFEFKNLRWTKNAYSKLLIPYIFADYNKIIYLDCDILCLSDAADLLNEVPAGFMLAAVRNQKTSLPYFNSGILVFKTEEFRKNISFDDIMNLSVSKYWNAPDQDILNYVCKGKVYYMRTSWNEFLKNDIDGKDNMLHFVYDKPVMNCVKTNPRVKLFWQYAGKTPFFNILLDKQRENTCFTDCSITLDRIRIYDDLKNNRNYGLRFIIKCLYCWFIGKLKSICSGKKYIPPEGQRR